MRKCLSTSISILWNGLPGQAYDFLNLNYPAGNFRYWGIMTPVRILRKHRTSPRLEAHQSRMWDKVFEEL